MRFHHIISTITAFLFVCLPASAQEPRKIDWPELLPKGEEERLFEEREAAANLPLFDHEQQGSDFGPDPGSDFGEAPGVMGGGERKGALAQGGTFKVVEELDGKLVSIAGFVVPLDFSGRDELTGFLLVPYFGACIHYPPPPPNQIIYVTSDRPVPLTDLYQAYRLTGQLTTNRHYNELGNAAYTLELRDWAEEN